ncbi:MAG: MBL fold metallo-hydrolase [Roseovarius sp.]|nr:MBL fold metallo-hydrolase [Roseovarius sp.]MCY4207374.1 MBL fold metallo-hydrolase [Roseovarius sp.]MCY4291083.1 MBL fold metallo-hydrolase [Roseovarius sp.]MCY4316155.1 MBL fold metallo-hydrolase [Roseovarius sp.]
MNLTRPTRRDMLKFAACSTSFSSPFALAAELGASQDGNPAYFRFSIGDAKATVVSDGYFSLPTSGIGINAEPEEVRAFLKRHFLSPEMNYSHTNHLHIEIGDARILVDVGSGNRFFDTAGRLMENLETAGIDPYEISHVVITHAHPDHIWGIIDDFDEAIFPDAEYIIGESEFAHWTQDGLVDRVQPQEQQFVIGAVNSLGVDGVEWTLASDGHEVVPGVTLIGTPGHTPGHMSVLLDGGDASLLALGDSIVHAYIGFSKPEWYNVFDSDGPMGVETRMRILDMAASDQIALLGYHFPFPGVGHVMREGETYRFIPAMWKF